MKPLSYALLIAWLVSSLGAQELPRSDRFTFLEKAQLDSLMLAGDFGQVRVFFADKDSLAAQTGPDALHYVKTRDRYLDRIKQITAFDHGTSKVSTDELAGTSSLFTRKKAGRNGYQAFSKFLQLVHAQDSHARRFYYIALFFKQEHIAEVLQTMRTSVRTATALLDQRELADASAVANAIDLGLREHAWVAPLADSVDYLRIKIAEEITLGQKRDWQRDRQLRFSADISVGASAFFKNRIEGGLLHFVDNETGDVRVFDVDIASGEGGGLAIEGQYYLRNQIALGLDFEYARFNYHSRGVRKFINFDFNWHHFLADIYGQFLYRNTTGVRPFAKLGAGIFQAYRNRAAVSHVARTGNRLEDSVVHSTLERSSLTAVRLLVGVGAEYAPRSFPRFVVRGGYTLRVSSRSLDFVSRVSHSLNLRLGFRL